MSFWNFIHFLLKTIVFSLLTSFMVCCLSIWRDLKAAIIILLFQSDTDRFSPHKNKHFLILKRVRIECPKVKCPKDFKYPNYSETWLVSVKKSVESPKGKTSVQKIKCPKTRLNKNYFGHSIRPLLIGFGVDLNSNCFVDMWVGRSLFAFCSISFEVSIPIYNFIETDASKLNLYLLTDSFLYFFFKHVK